MAQTNRHCQEYVRKWDRDRFLTGLFAKSIHRQQLYSLYAFDVEIARIRNKVSDALPGEVRIQWWYDLINGVGEGGANDHPIAKALLDTISRHNMPVAAFSDYLEARIFDLYEEPIRDFSHLKKYVEGTSTVMFQLASGILTEEQQISADEAFHHAGFAYALTKILCDLPLHSRRRQLYLPEEALERHKVDRNDIFNLKSTNELLNLLREMRTRIRTHNHEFRQCMKSIPGDVLPAFLPLCLVDAYLEEMETENYKPFESRIELNPLRRLYLIISSAMNVRNQVPSEF